jgi:hypothetical protein
MTDKQEAKTLYDLIENFKNELQPLDKTFCDLYECRDCPLYDEFYCQTSKLKRSLSECLESLSDEIHNWR